VFELIKAGGWSMLPLILCSITSMAIVIERFWSLQRKRVTPANLVAQVWQWSRAGVLDERRVQALRDGSPLGRVLAAGLANRGFSREVMKEGIEEVGRHVVHELGRHLNMLGTIASISPLLGLFGTVIGMIKMFSAASAHGVGDPTALAGGIATALVSTAGGLMVAIPTLLFYRYFRSRVDDIVMTMEQEALKLVEVMKGERSRDPEMEEAQA
jgi:biopolymer transport protein ExbB